MLDAPDSVQPFKAPSKALRSLDPDVVGALIGASTDLALVIDRKGVIRDVSFHKGDINEGILAWVGQRWIDTVTVESRPKVEDMLKAAASEALTRPRQVNQLAPDGQAMVMLYSTVPLGQEGRLIAIGRDLKAVAQLQKRLVEAQQSMEREYARLRTVEARYRFLFQATSEPILVIDATTLKIVEINAAANHLLGSNGKRVPGQTFRQLLAPAAAQTLEQLLLSVRSVGRAEGIPLTLGNPKCEMIASASLFRQEGSMHILLRLAPVTAPTALPAAKQNSTNLLRILNAVPDGFVVTSIDGAILTANQAFLDLVQLHSEERATGEMLERFLGRSGVDFDVLISNLKEHGSVRRFSTTVRAEFGFTTNVEISAVHVPDGDPPCFGFVIHAAGSQTARLAKTEPPRSVEQMKEVISRAPLKDVVRETTDAIERLCIQAALEMTGDNRASAADLLGLSRQSLYGKLRRFGIGGLGEPEDEG